MDSETSAKNGNQRPKTSRAAGKEGKTTPKSVGMSREPRGTSVQSLTRGKESNQEPTQKPSGFLGNRREPAGTGDQSPSPSKLIALGVQKVLLPTRTCLTQTGASCCKTFLEGMFPCMSFVFTLSRHGFARRGPKLGCKSACFSHVAAHASSNHSSWFPPVPSGSLMFPKVFDYLKPPPTHTMEKPEGTKLPREGHEPVILYMSNAR